MRSNVAAKKVTIEIFKTFVVNSIVFFVNGFNRQLLISKNETMVTDADMTNSTAHYFIGIVYIRSIRVDVVSVTQEELGGLYNVTITNGFEFGWSS